MSKVPATSSTGTPIRLSGTRRVLGGAQGEVEVPLDGGRQELRDGEGGQLGVGHREHEAGAGEDRDRARPDRQARGDRRERPAAELDRPRQVDGDGTGREAGEAERAEHGGERVPGDPGDREQPGDPFRVGQGQLEHRVHADRPAHEHGAVDPEVVHHREPVLDELRDAHVLGVGRPVGAAGAAVVPGHDPDAAVGAQQRRPGPGVGPEAVAQHDGGPVDGALGVVGPGPQAGPVVGQHVVERDAGLEGARGGG